MPTEGGLSALASDPLPRLVRGGESAARTAPSPLVIVVPGPRRAGAPAVGGFATRPRDTLPGLLVGCLKSPFLVRRLSPGAGDALSRLLVGCLESPHAVRRLSPGAGDTLPCLLVRRLESAHAMRRLPSGACNSLSRRFVRGLKSPFRMWRFPASTRDSLPSLLVGRGKAPVRLALFFFCVGCHGAVSGDGGCCRPPLQFYNGDSYAHIC